MSETDATDLKTLLLRAWKGDPSTRAQEYVNAFFDATRVGPKIVARVEGNHGTYTVSIEVKENRLASACSCYIGKGGYCHHCEALAHAYLQSPSQFREVELKKREEIQSMSDLYDYLQSVTLDSLLKQLSEKGITQKAFAESINMNPRQLSAIKSVMRRIAILTNWALPSWLASGFWSMSRSSRVGKRRTGDVDNFWNRDIQWR